MGIHHVSWHLLRAQRPRRATSSAVGHAAQTVESQLSQVAALRASTDALRRSASAFRAAAHSLSSSPKAI